MSMLRERAGLTRRPSASGPAFSEKGLVDGLPKRSGPLPDPAVQRRNEEIRRRYAEGEKQVAIAKDFGISQTHVSRICKGVERKEKPRRSYPALEKRNAEIRRRYAEGETPASLATAFGHSWTTMGRICKGARDRPSKEEIERRNSEIRRRYAEGEKQIVLALEFDLSEGSIRRICKALKEKPSKEEIERRNAEIRRRYAEGERPILLAQEFGLSDSRIYAICKGVERKARPKMGRPPIPGIEERNEEIRRRYAEGERPILLAQEFGLSGSRICTICKGVEQKVKPKREQNLALQKRNEEIRRRYANGERTAALVKEFGISRQRIHKIRKEAEETIPKPKRIRPGLAIAERNAEIRRRYAGGETQTSLATEFELSQAHVSHICWGVKRR